MNGFILKNDIMNLPIAQKKKKKKHAWSTSWLQNGLCLTTNSRWSQCELFTIENVL